MTDIKIFKELEPLLSTAKEASGVPGCVVAVYHKGAFYEAAAGVVNFKTNAPVTTDSVFQIGSITKSFTATLAMMLVSEGKLDLDSPVTNYLPNFTLAEKGGSQKITIRHLLTHTSGIDGDLITDTGRGEDALEKFVELLQEVALLYPTGLFFSYANVGYNILGRIIEVIEGVSFEKVLRKRILNPLDMTHAAMSAEEALFFNTAIGHEMRADGSGLQHAETAYSPKSNAPSGTVLGMSARDLLKFARFHINRGINENNLRLLDEEIAAEMTKMHVEIPLSDRYTSWGLGWMQYYWGDADSFGHDGGWMGMSAYLRISPENDFAVVLFANGPGAAQLYQDVMEPLLLAGTGLLSPELPCAPDQNNFNLSLYCGRYARHGQYIDVFESDGRLRASLSGEYMGGTTLVFDVNLLQKDRAACDFSITPRPISGYFLEFDGIGHPAYFHITERAFRRQ